MSTPGRLPALAMMAMVAVGCSETIDPADITLQDLVGTWNATKVEYTPDGGGAAFDLIDNGGSATLTLSASGTLTGTFTFAGQSDEIDGTVSLANGRLTLTEPGEGGDPPEVTVFDVTLSGNTLTLTSDDVEFDFNFDGENEPASVVIVGVKQ
jgi:hypothetical protein